MYNGTTSSSTTCRVQGTTPASLRDARQNQNKIQEHEEERAVGIEGIVIEYAVGGNPNAVAELEPGLPSVLRYRCRTYVDTMPVLRQKEEGQAAVVAATGNASQTSNGTTNSVCHQRVRTNHEE